MVDVVIIGGGPGGYEAGLVASQLGGRVTIVENKGLGGSAVLTDVVPSKSLIAASEVMEKVRGAEALGLRATQGGTLQENVAVDMAAVNDRVLRLASAQSGDIAKRLETEGVRLIKGTGRLDGTEHVVVTAEDGAEERLDADIILVSTGARPRELPDAMPDGERILNWTQMYNLTEPPKRLIVVGSGVTGAEFASAYNALGVDVVLVSSRRQVLPSQDDDAARVLQEVFEATGMTILSESRANSARRTEDGVIVGLQDGREIEGSHVLMAVGAIPNTEDLGLAEAGIEVSESGHIVVDKVSRTSARGVYAAGDCTGVFALASVAAMQGRIAMWHALGDAVSPLNLRSISSNVFTAPEIATVGVGQAEIDAGLVAARTVVMPLRSNARAKMQSLRDGFIKVFCLPTTGIVIGGVIVAPQASELIYPLAMAVNSKITVDEAAQSFTVYPSLSGSIAEASRRLHTGGVDESLY
ncbi:NAD(P)H-quinone dehydrogenase [Nigerium massiliense]|uniref:NAD(P)H-quinone dehydrogenase n=1 Tax=Nigerium massiliense TaxID=1522317 RepID=UPI000A57C5D2|nr:NAD(P)H-quinone dehydrogenase [Nigerium massiliense]